MDFSPFQNKEGVGAPAAQIARVQYSNQGEQALVQAQGETANVLTKGFTAMKDQVEQTQALAANNMYNKLMSEGTSELMQKKKKVPSISRMTTTSSRKRRWTRYLPSTGASFVMARVREHSTSSPSVTM